MRTDAAVQRVDLYLQSRHHLLLIGDLSVNHLQSRQLRLHILASVGQLILRFRHFLFEVRLFVLQFPDSLVGRRWRRLTLLSRLLGLFCGVLGRFL